MTDAEERTPYVESPVITTVIRAVVPFVFVYGFYLTLHGTSLPGGGFQGGIVMGSTVVLIALAFGLTPTRRWIDDGVLAAALLFGVGAFGGVALGAIAFDGAVLEIAAYPLAVPYTAEFVELAIGVLVAVVVVGLVVWIAAGVTADVGGDRP